MRERREVKFRQGNYPRKGDGMETVNVSEIRSLLLKAQSSLAVALHGIENKTLIGEINRPTNSPPKIKRKRRTKKEIEKEYHTERHEGIPEPTEPLPDADEGSTFYGKKKKREKKVAEVE